eukprot:854075-Rhodomonas_salina.1
MAWVLLGVDAYVLLTRDTSADQIVFGITTGPAPPSTLHPPSTKPSRLCNSAARPRSWLCAVWNALAASAHAVSFWLCAAC